MKELEILGKGGNLYLKQKSFKFKESLSKVVCDLSNEEAGELIKGICAYYFESKTYKPSNPAIKNCFIFIKSMLDEEEQSRTYGKKGAEIKKQKQSKIVMVTKITKEGEPSAEPEGKCVAKKSKK